MKVIFASNNAGKTREVAAALAGLDIELVPQSQFQVVEAEETGLTFVENALLKARNACRQTGLPAIADDSGVEVDALNGAPGVYSARYAGPSADDAANNARLLRELADVPDAQRTARYQCVMVYLRHADDPTPIICQAAWEGLILREPRGEGGFGYDPLFWLAEPGQTAAELDLATKNQLSHRGQALRQLLAALGGNIA
ncbi:MAG TPA: RdgB/HAM1 family non-canonical purine NTP pyrophosphatase [Gammaproteobacteria bacterium]|nr:RdgB/HAM1 family non-canonical purine NTP pyrophosphatase [Gammaproteobacteria bacterium]